MRILAKIKREFPCILVFDVFTFCIDCFPSGLCIHSTRHTDFPRLLSWLIRLYSIDLLLALVNAEVFIQFLFNCKLRAPIEVLIKDIKFILNLAKEVTNAPQHS